MTIDSLQMPKKGRAELELLCLKEAKTVLGAGGVKTVSIKNFVHPDRGPNWDIAQITPLQTGLVEKEIRSKIARLRGTYALDE